MAITLPRPGDILTRAEVAAMFRVGPSTVAEWDKAGLFPAGCVFRTPGGRRRFRAGPLRAWLAGRPRFVCPHCNPGTRSATTFQPADGQCGRVLRESWFSAVTGRCGGLVCGVCGLCQTCAASREQVPA